MGVDWTGGRVEHTEAPHMIQDPAYRPDWALMQAAHSAHVSCICNSRTSTGLCSSLMVIPSVEKANYFYLTYRVPQTSEIL